MGMEKLWSKSDAWWYKRLLTRKATFWKANDLAKTRVSTFFNKSKSMVSTKLREAGWCLDPKVLLETRAILGREAWNKMWYLIIEMMLRKRNFRIANDLCQDSGFYFSQTILGRCLDPRAMIVDESDTWMAEEKPGSKSNAWWWELWPDSKSKFLESKRSCKDSDFNFLQITLRKIDGQCESARSRPILAKSSEAWRWEVWRTRGAMV